MFECYSIVQYLVLKCCVIGVAASAAAAAAARRKNTHSSRTLAEVSEYLRLRKSALCEGVHRNSVKLFLMSFTNINSVVKYSWLLLDRFVVVYF